MVEEGSLILVGLVLGTPPAEEDAPCLSQALTASPMRGPSLLP